MLSIPPYTLSLQSGPTRREVALRQVPLEGVDPSGDIAIVRNLMTLIDSGYDLSHLERSETEGVWLQLGRLAIGRVEQPARTGPAEGDIIYWLGPHAEFGPLEPAREIWCPVPNPEPRLLPAGIGVEAQYGIEQAVDALGAFPAESVVLGQGMLGHLAAQWLRYMGSEVSVVDNSPKRLEFSRKSGLARKIDTHNFDWMARLRALHPDGVPLIVDAAGAPAAVEALLPMLARGGALCLLGQWRTRMLPASIEEQFKRVSAKITGPAPWLGGVEEHSPLLQEWIDVIYRGDIPTERLLTHHITPQEGPMAVKRFAAGIRSWQGCVIHWDPAMQRKFIGESGGDSEARS